MISGIQIALKNAIDVIAPPATPLQDFTYHWKQLMNFYVSHLTDCKVPVQNTSIPRHLDVLLDILLQEEKEENEPGPCLEYLLQHKLLDLLATLASAETPPGMRTVCLAFLRKFLGRSKYPLLHHASIYAPIQRLVALCNGNPPSPIEAEEVQFLLTICFLVCKYPHVTNIINDAPVVEAVNNPAKKDNERTEIQKERRRLPRSNHVFKTTASDPGHLSRRSNESVSSREESVSSSPLAQKSVCDSPSLDTKGGEQWEEKDRGDSSRNKIDEHLQNLRDLRLDTDCNVYEDASYVAGDDQSLKSPKMPGKSKCLLLDALMSYLNSADNTVRIRACEGIMVLASLDDPSFAQTVTRSQLPSIISTRLEHLFNAIPAHVDHLDIYNVDVTWGLDSPLWTQEKKFPGCRQVAAFFMWYDYCDQLIREAHLELAETLARTIRVMFFERIVTPALADHHVVLITALVAKCLKETTSSILCTEVSYWLVGQDRDPEMPNVWTSPVLHRLIENCFTDSNDLTIETLKLFEEAIDKRNEHILHCLLLIYLSTRAYYDNTAADSAIASWSDEEDEREKDKRGTLDLSYEQNHSRTLAPSNIHRVINCFLSLMPRYLQTDPDVNNYEKYMPAWEQQYTSVLSDCALMAWPLEAVMVDDSGSSDSRPEADHCSGRFYMGPFLSMLFDKIGNMPRQTYEINLEITGLISRLALLPHPYLHEFLLNPLLPLIPGTKSLFLCLQKIVKQLVSEIPKTPENKIMLAETRQRLLSNCSQEEDKENILYESAVVTEEFCKDLAAIAYVKYHHSV
ncbi:PREDICTED: protein FAM160B1-like isoform X3 [Wasmannia auropunctata]|uniref:protein FAM160B1-like isoform X3 n=1 Tax=Wasmannia auropunctata TaxID=64793 RepID=UPI0005EEE67F|nr:PREDICTED: protein FAM160B1-like isoform X3 [Wasmannia auropunctata]